MLLPFRHTSEAPGVGPVDLIEPVGLYPTPVGVEIRRDPLEQRTKFWIDIITLDAKDVFFDDMVQCFSHAGPDALHLAPVQAACIADIELGELVGEEFRWAG